MSPETPTRRQGHFQGKRRSGVAVALLLTLVLACLTVPGAVGAQPQAGANASTPSGTSSGAASPATPASPAAPAEGAAPAQPSAQATPKPAPPPPVVIPDDITQPIAKLTGEIAAAESALDQARDRDEELIRLRREVQGIADQAHAFADHVKPRLESVKQQIAKLGPLPAKDAPPEPDAVVHERAKLNALAGAMDGAIRTADLLAERASQVIDRIQQHQRDLFTRSVLKRTPSPILPTLWIELMRESKRGIADINRLVGNWWSIAAGSKADLTLALTGVLIVWLVLRSLGRYLIKTYRDADRGEQTFFARAAAAAWVAPAIALPPIIAMGLVYLAFDHLDLMYLGLRRMTETMLHAVIAFSTVTALAHALLTPRRPNWRLFQLSDTSAARVRWLMVLIGAVYAIDLLLKELNNIIFAPLSVTIAQSFLAGVAFAGLLIALVRTPFQPRRAAEPHTTAPTEAVEAPEPEVAMPLATSRLEPRWLKLPLWLVAIVIIAAAMLGYVSLARFLSGQIVVTGSILIALILLHHAVRALSEDIADASKTSGRWLHDQLGFDESRRKQLALLFNVVVNGGLVLLALPLVLLQWGFDWEVVRGWFMAALFGFKIGSVEVSLTRILMALAIMVAGIFATRLLQRSLDKSVLTPQRMDIGIANSIRTAIGYAGFGAAFMLAVSYAGLDFTNLAIVAGALSVGIGFGLQSVVNNFVSGLILLVERPVKVGDWIVAGSDEGIVRRISVRSTEIETFDRSSVVIPNAELIQGRVKNWTLRDAVGRMRIPIGIAYDADPNRAKEVLLKLADEHTEVLKFPAPFVSFDKFGTSSVDLTLNFFVGNLNVGGRIKTEMAFAILKAFKDAGIEIPFDQHDVRLRDLDPVRDLLHKAIEERRRQAESAQSEAGEPSRDVTPDVTLKSA